MVGVDDDAAVDVFLNESINDGKGAVGSFGSRLAMLKSEVLNCAGEELDPNSWSCKLITTGLDDVEAAGMAEKKPFLEVVVVVGVDSEAIPLFSKAL